MGMNATGGAASNLTYLGVYSNQLVLQYDKKEELEAKLESLGYDIDKIEERKKTKGKNEGQTVYYFVIYDVEGMLSKITINEQDWGDVVEIEITDVDEKIVISLGDVFSRTAKDFIRRLGNLDLTDQVNFGLWSMSAEETGKSARSGVKMYQNDEKVDYFLTYDDMPAPVETKKGRKVEWNYDEQEAFLYDQLLKYIEDNFKADVKDSSADDKPAEKAPTPKQERKSRKPVASAKASQAEDDLPF